MTKALFYFHFFDNNKKIKINFLSLREEDKEKKKMSREKNHVLKYYNRYT
jgi:hypothetical protein